MLQEHYINAAVELPGSPPLSVTIMAQEHGRFAHMRQMVYGFVVIKKFLKTSECTPTER